MRIRSRLLMAVTLFMACVGLSFAGSVSGPLVGGKQGKAFNLPDMDLAKHGYVAEEFFLDGTAAAYQVVPGTTQESDGRWKLQRRADSEPFRTRLLVVRPVDAKQFNGTVIVHWQNVTAGYELGSVAEGNEYLRGYAWVGVSAQKVGIDGFPGPQAAGLRQWDPDRYGSLKHPGDDYSFDIFAQAGRAVGPKRDTSGVDPMAKLPVKRIVAAGASQSAARLRAYINGIHPIEPVFDGFIPYIDFARAMSFGAQPATPASPPAAGALNSAAPILGRAHTIIRTDLDAPVFVVNSETEAEGYVVSRQPDTNTFRFWEVAGSSHVNVLRSQLGQRTDLESPNWLPYRPAYDASIRHMHAWLSTGKAPPTAPLIEMQALGPAKIKRDAMGNAIGGIRLPDFAVATAEHRGGGTNKPGGYRLGFLYGFAREFTDQELHALYPDSKSFLAKYDAAIADSVSKGFMLAEDAPAMRAAAAEWTKRLDHH